MKTVIANIVVVLVLCLSVLQSIDCYESPKPTKHGLKCLIDIYKRDDFLRCGSQVTAKWNLTDDGPQDLKQKCCSIFDLWDCIDQLARRLCTKIEHKDVQLFKEQLIGAANKNECQGFNYQSNNCVHEETENLIL